MEIAPFKELLKKLKLTLDSKGISDYQRMIGFRNGKAMTFNGLCGTVVKCEVGFECCVFGEEFIDQISKLDEDIELSFKDPIVHLKSGKLKAKFKTTPIVEFPDFIPKDRSELIREDPLLFPGLESVAPFVGDKMNALGGICIVQDRIYACTEKTATRAMLSKEISDIVHIPESAVESILKFGAPTMLFRARDLVGAYYPDSVTITNQIVARFPWEQVDTAFDVEGPEVTLPDDVKGVLKRITPSVDDSGDATLSGTQTHLTIATESASEDMEWQGCPEPWSCRVNLKRFGEATKKLKVMRLGSLFTDDPRALVFVGDNYLHAMGLQSE